LTALAAPDRKRNAPLASGTPFAPTIAGRSARMAPAEEENITDIAAQIMAHMLRNPDAVDGLEGLSRFRLLEQRIQQSVANTEEALHWLVSMGLVLEERTGQGTPSYRLNPIRMKDAINLGGKRQKEDS